MMCLPLKNLDMIQNIHMVQDVLFSAVITAELAKGKSMFDAVQKAKKFISLSIKHTPEIGLGRGPVNHFAYMKEVGLDDE